MKGYRLRIWFYQRIAVLLTLFLTFFTVQSWSQNAFGKYNDLLNAALIIIALHFYETGLNHTLANVPVHKWFGTKIRLRHLCLITAFFFCGILIFPLGSQLFADIFHLVATGLAVASMFWLISGWYGMWSEDWWWFMVALVISTLLLIGAFALDVPWQVGHGEFALLLTGLWFFNKIKD